MKINYILLLCSTFLILGCGNEENNDKKSPIQTLTKISGVSTLGNATVCIDSNGDNSCNQNETSTKSQADGSYKLETTQTLSQGIHIIAYEGDNLILLERNNTKLLLIAPYHKTKRELNINTLTTLVSVAMKESKSYDEAVAFVADKYELDSDLITQNPFETVKEQSTQIHLQTINVIEEGFVHGISKNKSILRSSFSLEPISFEDADSAFDYIDIIIFNPIKYTAILGLFILKKVGEASTFFNGSLVDIGLTDGRTDEKQLNDKYDSIDKITLHPFLLKILNNQIVTIDEEEINSFVESLKDNEINDKLYSDMTSLFYKNINDFNLTTKNDIATRNTYIVSLLGKVGDKKTVKYMVEMLHIMVINDSVTYLESPEGYTFKEGNITFEKQKEDMRDAFEIIMKSFEDVLDAVTYNKETNTIRIENLETFSDYGSAFYRKFTSKYHEKLTTRVHQIIAIAISKIGDHSEIDDIFKAIINRRYSWYNHNYNDNFIQILLSNAKKSDLAVKILYDMASEIQESDTQKSEKILEYFTIIKTNRPDLQEIIEDAEFRGYFNEPEYHFASETLKAEIKAL